VTHRAEWASIQPEHEFSTPAGGYGKTERVAGRYEKEEGMKSGTGTGGDGRRFVERLDRPSSDANKKPTKKWGRGKSADEKDFQYRVRAQRSSLESTPDEGMN